MENKSPIQVADKLFACLEYLASNGESNLSQISKNLDINKTTVHRLLATLINLGYVKQEPNSLKYYLSFKICSLSNQILSNNDMVSICRPYLEKIRDLTGETVHLVKLDENDAIYIDKVDSLSNSIRLVSKVGKAIPLYCSGVGKALLAHKNDEEIKEYYNSQKIVRYTNNTPITFKQLMKKINFARENNYALDEEEMEMGVKCVAVALKDIENKYSYAISISSPIVRITNKKIKEHSKYLLDAKKEIESQLFIK